MIDALAPTHPGRWRHRDLDGIEREHVIVEGEGGVLTVEGTKTWAITMSGTWVEAPALDVQVSGPVIQPSDEYRTPDVWVERVRLVLGGDIDLDPCSNPAADLACVNWRFLRDGDSLVKPWGEIHGSRVRHAFVNPPYSQPNLALWTAKILRETADGLELIALVPCDPSTVWWRELYEACSRNAYSKRIKFVGAKDSAKFSSSFFYFGPRCATFARVFTDAKCLVVAP